MNLECNSLTSCSYLAFELIADQSIYFAAKSIMDPHARNGPGTPLAIALISKIGSLSLYYRKKLEDHFIHPMPTMSYSGVKGIFGAYIADLFHRYIQMSSNAGTVVSIVAANVLTVVEHFLFENEHKSTDSNFLCDYSWREESKATSANTTKIARSSPSSDAFNLLADIPNIVLRFGTLFFMRKSISAQRFSQIFALSVLSLSIHASVLRFGNQDSKFIKECKALNSKIHMPVVSGMLLKLFVDYVSKKSIEHTYPRINFWAKVFFINAIPTFYLAINFVATASNSDSFFSVLRCYFNMFTLEGDCAQKSDFKDVAKKIIDLNRGKPVV